MDAYSEMLKDHKYRIDYRDVGSSLDRLAQSTLTQQLLIRQVASLGIEKRQATICLFGSAARGEFDSRWSDIDLLFVGFKEQERDELLAAIVSQNAGFDFHGAKELLSNRESDTGTTLNLRFPCISKSELVNKQEPRRRIQFLFEAKPIYGEEYCDQLLEMIIGHYGLEPKSKMRTTPETLIQDIDSFYAEMAVECSERTDKSSDFFAKYFAMREFGQHLVRLSLIAAIFEKKANLESTSPALAFALKLRQPNLLKLLFWSTNLFVDGRTMTFLKDNHVEELSKTLRSHLDALHDEASELRAGLTPDDMFHIFVGVASRQYTETFDILNNHTFRTHLSSQNPNVLNWNTDPNLERMSDQCKGFRRTLTCLGGAIASVFHLSGITKGIQKSLRGKSGLDVAIESFRRHLRSTQS